jgi:uncharacterized protein YjgD (DUF1641 family)
MTPPNTNMLNRIEEKLDEVKSQLAELTTKVAVMADHVARQNGRIDKLEGICKDQQKDTVEQKTDITALREATRNLTNMENRAWKVVIGVSLALLGGVITIVIGILKGDIHIGGLP